MNNTTRAVIATAAIGALLIPLAGCGNTTTSSGKTELTVWSWDTSINRAAKSFMKANPDITVKVSNVGNPTRPTRHSTTRPKPAAVCLTSP